MTRFILTKWPAWSKVNLSFLHLQTIRVSIEGTIMRTILELKVDDSIDTLFNGVPLNIYFNRSVIAESTFVVCDPYSSQNFIRLFSICQVKLHGLNVIILKVDDTLVVHHLIIKTPEVLNILLRNIGLEEVSSFGVVRVVLIAIMTVIGYILTKPNGEGLISFGVFQVELTTRNSCSDVSSRIRTGWRSSLRKLC